MWNTERKVKGIRQKAKAGARSARRSSRRLLFTFFLLPFSFYLSGCRMDMQDQPRYEAYEPGDRKMFPDGQSSRAPVEGTVARMPAGQEYVDRQTDYFYTGQMGIGVGGAQQGAGGAGQSSTGGAATGQSAGSVITSGGMSAGAGGQAAGGDTNTRGQAADASMTGRAGGPDVFPFPVTMAELERGRDRYDNFCSMCHGITGDSDGMIVRRGFQRPPALHDDGLQPGQASAAHLFTIITNGLGAMPSYASMIPPEDRWKIVAYVRALQRSRRGTLADVPEGERGKLAGGNQGGAQQPAHGGEQH